MQYIKTKCIISAYFSIILLESVLRLTGNNIIRKRSEYYAKRFNPI